jgi:hypothetical protein
MNEQPVHDALYDPVMDCQRCGADKYHQSEGEWVTDGATRVNHMIVSYDYMWICPTCFRKQEEGE